MPSRKRDITVPRVLGLTLPWKRGKEPPGVPKGWFMHRAGGEALLFALAAGPVRSAVPGRLLEFGPAEL